jgi:hypothetical protein
VLLCGVLLCSVHAPPAQVESVLGALETELVQGQPEVNKIATLRCHKGAGHSGAVR